MRSVLIVHRDPEVIKMLETALIIKGVGVTQVADGAGAIDLFCKTNPTAVLAEVDNPAFGGLELLRRVKVQDEDLPIVLISPDTTARAAREALRAGAFDYLTQPIDPNELADCLNRLFDESEPVIEADPAGRPGGRYDYIIGESKAIRDVFRLVDKVADTDSTVMIYGESGTGKELIARAIHQNSRRRYKPLIPVNCGAIPEELLESELFGHEKGAFTSAIRTRIGRFELADGGTIFLDEIADMSPKLQVKILRVLQEHRFERIGGTRTLDVDIRVITATNKDLRQAMEKGLFREDLFYRLNVIPITAPPLRERRSDIPILVEYFINRFRRIKGAAVRGLEPEVISRLTDYHWPGNIRELENIIERMVILAESDIITIKDLPERIAKAGPIARGPFIEITEDGIDFNQVISDFENQLLLQALEKADWVKNKAAQLLKLNRTTLVEKLKKKELLKPDGETTRD